MFERREIINPWEGRIDPFKIVGNVYFVGTFQASSHLIDTGNGLIIIDTGYENTLYLLIDSIHRLGYDPKDIKYIINTHWHWDHVEGSAALAELSCAKNIIGYNDADNARKYFNPDILVKDGDILSLGNVSIRFMETPGHTKGTMSIFFDSEENGKIYKVGMFGGAGANTLMPGTYEYDECRSDYFNSIEKLYKEKVDVFIGNHTWNNDTFNKAEVLKKTGKNEFIDEVLWYKFLDYCKARAKSIIV